MQIFNIGFLELVFILLLAMVIFGPQDLAKTGRQLGKFIRNFTNSDIFMSVLDASREISDLPQKLVREVGAEEIMEDINRIKNARQDEKDFTESDLDQRIDPGISEPPDSPATLK